ncbi:MAG: D-alanine--D-alanine ligase [Myxococcota bacterium]|jgi:D-alanine-D-alanine ligase|nr:D-alanine--D-alanine ligase [Myxococcota bacterium]
MQKRWLGRRVAVLEGGLSSEREVSLASGKAVASALRTRGHDVVEIDVGRDLPRQIQDAGAEVAVIMLHGTYGEDGCVQGMLEVLDVPYTGSGVGASSLCMDKVRTKRLLAQAGLPVAEDKVVGPGHWQDAVLPFDPPVVVKPAEEGSSVGCSIVDAAGDYGAALMEAGRWGSVLVERFHPGPEVTVTVLDGEPLPPVEIRPGEGFYDYTNKYTSGRTSYICPAEIDPAVAERIKGMAATACEATGVRGVARVDFMLGGGADPVVLEVNTIPGMTELSLVPMAAQEAGLTFEELAERILEGASLHCEAAS